MLRLEKKTGDAEHRNHFEAAHDRPAASGRFRLWEPAEAPHNGGEAQTTESHPGT